MQKKVYRVPEMTCQRVELESGLMAGSPIKADVKVKPFEENTENLDDFEINF